MKQLRSMSEYERILNQNDVSAVVLFYTENDVECSIAELNLNKLSKKYSDDFLFSKIMMNDKVIDINNQWIELPIIQLNINGYQVIYKNPIQYELVEKKISEIVEKQEYMSITNLPPRPDRIKRRILEKRWIAWTFVIGGALIAIIKFLIEMDKREKKQ